MDDSIQSSSRKELVLKVLEAVTKAGVLVKIVVFDGHPSNIAMSEILIGKKLDVFAPDFQTFFLNPTNEEKV